jgi:hypothetical protein
MSYLDHLQMYTRFLHIATPPQRPALCREVNCVLALAQAALDRKFILCNIFNMNLCGCNILIS